MSTFSIVIQYSNFSDLKERLHDMLDELTTLDTTVVAASEMPIGELIEFTRDRAWREMQMGFEPVALSSADEVAESDDSGQDAPEPIDLEALKSQSIERLKEIYVQPGGAKIIDRLIKKHGGGETLFTKISAERYVAMMSDLDAELQK